MRKFLVALGMAALPATAHAAPFLFTPGDLVISVVGQVDASGVYGADNAAAPI